MKERVKIICINCNKIFEVRTGVYNNTIIKNGIKMKCSKQCANEYKTRTIIECECKHCKGIFKKPANSKQVFCSQTCSATFNNTHKSYGNRRSKLEIWLEQQISLSYPNLNIFYNKKDTINSELDIYIPSLKLGFELNGIYHYEPIHGTELLKKIQNNDNRKFQACLEHGIELCIIDSSKMYNFTEKGANQYLKIIQNIISLKNGPGQI